MNNDTEESECVVIQKEGGEVGKRGVGWRYLKVPLAPTPARQAWR
jgi:hypothetical protein